MRRLRATRRANQNRAVLAVDFLSKKFTKSDNKNPRIRERVQLALPVKVHCRETVDHEWTEMSRLRDVTPFGARFTLKRPTEIGRLLHLTLPMPRPLRVFDHVEDQYRIWCIVRNLKLLDPAKEKDALIEIGVAFIGKRPPRNFESDPSQRYDIAQSAGEMIWSVKDDEADPKVIELPETDQRKESRYTIP